MTHPKLIEVAKAIWERRPATEEYQDWEEYLAPARAAIQCLMEPTEDMLERAQREAIPYEPARIDGMNIYDSKRVYKRRWQSMLITILNGKDEG